MTLVCKKDVTVRNTSDKRNVLLRNYYLIENLFQAVVFFSINIGVEIINSCTDIPN